MAHAEVHADTTPRGAMPGTTFPEWAELGRQRLEALMGAQKELFETFEEVNRDWVSRAKSEAELASEFFAKLVSAKSLPDAARIYQECAGRQLDMLAEDSRRFLVASQKIMNCVWQNGSLSRESH
jgi:hypothetical protein